MGILSQGLPETTYILPPSPFSPSRPSSSLPTRPGGPRGGGGGRKNGLLLIVKKSGGESIFSNDENQFDQNEMTELPEGYAEELPPRVLHLRVLRQAVCQLALLPGGRPSILRRRLERVVYDQVRVVWVPH